MHGERAFLGVIPARGGSKGIPWKNLAPLRGRPLIAYTIESARDSRLLDRCIVSTESEEVAGIARAHGGDVPFLRPAELATDDALVLGTLAHALSALAAGGERFDYVVMLQPTSPLRLAEDIDACIELAVARDADSVFSMKQLTDFAAEKIKTLDPEGRIGSLLRDEVGQSAPRHVAPPAFKRNGAVYLTRSALIERGEQFGERSFGHVMPLERSLDINDPVDMELAEFWLAKAEHDGA